MVFHWNNVDALASYMGGNVIVIIDSHSKLNETIENAIQQAVYSFRGFCQDSCPSWLVTEKKTETVNMKVADFEKELKETKPIIYSQDAIIFFQGSD